MAIKKFKTSSIKNDVRYDSMLAGYPGVMAAPTATDGGTGTTASVAFTTVSGSTGYTALSNPGSLTGTGTSSPITVSGLTEGTAYTFQVRAENADGNGAYSAASNSVTPVDPAAYVSIATAYGSGSSGMITFSSIPQGYKNLQIRALVKDTNTSNYATGPLYIYVNDVSTYGAYFTHAMYGRGTGNVLAQNGVNDSWTSQASQISSGSAHAGMHAPAIIDIFDYSATNKSKVMRSFSGTMGTEFTTNFRLAMSSSVYNSSNAITSLSFYSGVSGAFTTTSQIALYGIKG